MTVTSTSRRGVNPATEAPPRTSSPGAQGTVSVVLVECAGQRFGIQSRHVEQVRSAVQLTRLPDAPPLIEGVVNLHGEIVPVLDGRRRIGISHRDVRLTDRFVVVRCRGRRLVIHVDAAVGVVDVPAADLDEAGALQLGAFGCKGISRLRGGLFVVHDIDSLLSPPEFARTERALAASSLGAGHAHE